MPIPISAFEQIGSFLGKEVPKVISGARGIFLSMLPLNNTAATGSLSRAAESAGATGLSQNIARSAIKSAGLTSTDASTGVVPTSFISQLASLAERGAAVGTGALAAQTVIKDVFPGAFGGKKHSIKRGKKHAHTYRTRHRRSSRKKRR